MPTPRPPSRRDHSHERIVETAARALRREGFDGVGVADIMKEAGLTHGGFYAHFASRDALLVEALERASEESARNIARVARAQGSSAFQQLVTAYLSEDHVKSVESGCPVAALVSEMPRQAAEVRKAASRSVRDLVAAVQSTAELDASEAAVIASQLIGAIQLARALSPADGKALLTSVRRQLLTQYDL